MKTLYLTFLIAIIYNHTFSQNYLSIKPDAISYYYGIDNESVFPIRIDSVITHGDSTEYYSFGMLRPLPNSYYFTEKGPSWIGKKMTDCGNGINLFFNYNNDTIFIKTDALLNESWKMYTYPNGDYINAKVTNIILDNYIGLIDSTKIINLQLKNSFGINLINALNNYQYKLSKNYGFFILTDFYSFPFNPGEPDSIYVSTPEMELVGISNPQHGMQNLTYADVNGMQAGDEIHYNYYYSGGAYPGSYSQHNESIYKYINRTENNAHDTIIFTVEICQFNTIQHYYPNSIVTSNYHNIVYNTISLNNSFNKLPLEPFFDGYTWGYYNKTDSIGYQPEHIYSLDYNDSLQPAILNGWGTTNFIKNHGSGTFQYYDYYDGSSSNQSFQYYKINGNEWGTPFICDSLLAHLTNVTNNGYTESGISFYPNPATNYININSNYESISSFNIKIYDMQGRILLIKQIADINQQIDVSSIPNGIYLVKIANLKTIDNYKLIISR